MSNKGSIEETKRDGTRGQTKCRIPQRRYPIRSMTAPIKKMSNAEPNVISVKVRQEAPHGQYNARPQNRSSRPRSTESRPKSGGRFKDDASSGKQVHTIKQARPERSPGPNKRSTTPRKPFNQYAKTTEYTVPVNARQLQRIQKLPDQETIKKFEEMELRSDNAEESEEKDVTQIKQTWKDKMVQFEKMKEELDQRQKDVMELYATLRNTHKMMTTLGHPVSLPSTEELNIMNVAKLTPDQLLQLCSGNRRSEDIRLTNEPLTIDMNKIYDMPTKLVATCEQTLIKRKEIIDWFESLKSEEKGIGKNKLIKKINEFNAENEMLNCSLQTCKTEFLKELNEIVGYLRRGVNETIALQLRTEELTYNISELNSKNEDLQKQVQAADQFKLQNNRRRVEELEKELKDEKCKKLVIKDRLTRVEGQLIMSEERASQLDAALELTRSQNRTLERTVHELHLQNQKLQSEFDEELNNLTESIKCNTARLEEIGEAREKLQAEKEDLERRLQELSDNNNDSLRCMKEELSDNISKLVETEKKLEKEKEERKNMESKFESLCAQLLENEMRYKDTVKLLQDKDTQLTHALSIKLELEMAKHELEIAKKEIEEYRIRLTKQNDAIKDIEHNFKETINLEKNLRNDIRNKEEYISELEKKELLLEQQLHDNEQKMESYEKQLSTVKNQMNMLQEHFGEFENATQLLDMIKDQRSKLLEMTQQNEKLSEALHKKDIELENHLEQLSEQDGVIKMLTNKEEEHANILKLLRNNLEMRVQAETDLTQQLTEKNAEIESLITNVDTRKQQISQLEKIILTLEDQLRKTHLQRLKDKEKLTVLEKTVTEYESYHVEPKRSIDTPAENLDNFIKMLEEELDTSFEAKKHELNKIPKKRYIVDRKHDEYSNSNLKEALVYHTEQDKTAANIVVGNFVKKTYLPTRDERDNLDRKRAITNMESQKLHSSLEQPCLEQTDLRFLPSDKDSLPPFRGLIPMMQSKDQHSISRNIQHLLKRHDDKKCRMFKFAGHNRF